MILDMAKRIDFTLTQEQLSAIEQAINHSVHAEVRQRAIAVRMLHLGQSPEQVAEAVMVTANTIYAWHKRWREEGVAGLRHRQRSGRPAKADAAYKQRVEELLELDPCDIGLDFNIWTINRLRLYLFEQTGIRLSYTRFRALLTRMGYTWKQPKHDLSDLQDADAQQAADELLDWLKKRQPIIRFPRSNSSLWTKRR
jgi:putative transposase